MTTFLSQIEEAGFTTSFDDSAFSCRCVVCGEWLHFSPAGLNAKGGTEAALADLENHRQQHAARPAQRGTMAAIEVEKFDGIVSVTMHMAMAEQLIGILDTFIRRHSITAIDSPESRQVQAAMEVYNELSRAGVL